MAQRDSGFQRRPDEDYRTPVWPVRALLTAIDPVHFAWDPCSGSGGRMITALRECGVRCVGSTQDFLTTSQPPAKNIDLLVANPPYGPSKRGEPAAAFIERALGLGIPRIAMLLAIDFDSAVTRPHLFRNCPTFAGKIVLLGRILWIENTNGRPSTNHCWLHWSRDHLGPPTIRYVSKREVTT